MTQQHAQKQTGKTEQPEATKTEAKDLQNKDLSNDVEDMLDEIDEVLEENAESFVKGFVQKGGQAVVCPERGNALSALRKWLSRAGAGLISQPVAVH